MLLPGSGDPAQVSSDAVAERLIETARTRARRGPRDREARAEGVAGAAFVLVALVMAAALPNDRHVAPLTLVLLALAWAATLRVTFEVGTGYTSPTVLVLIPSLYLVPAPLVPLTVALGYLLSSLLDALLGRRHIARWWLVFGQSWYAVGPALVFAAADVGAPSADDWPVLLAALASSIAGDAAVSLAVDRFGLRVPLRALIRPALWVYAVDVLLSPLGVLVAVLATRTPWAVLALLPLWALLAVFARERTRRYDAAIELSHAYRGTAMLLGDVIEANHEDTGTHARDVVTLAVAVGERMGLDPERQRRLEFGALLHDIGKIAVPERILNKPAPLDREERALMNRHTEVGQQMLDGVGGVLAEAGLVVRASHERWDGKGYPDGAQGAGIPLEARIISCCDAWSAMTRDRAYRRALSRREALQELRTNTGTQFDPIVARCLVEVLDDAQLAPARAAARGVLISARTGPAVG